MDYTCVENATTGQQKGQKPKKFESNWLEEMDGMAKTDVKSKVYLQPRPLCLFVITRKAQ